MPMPEILFKRVQNALRRDDEPQGHRDFSALMIAWIELMWKKSSERRGGCQGDPSGKALKML
jgi:hypothetical protein